MCVTDRHDMTLGVKVALNPNTTNQIKLKMKNMKKKEKFSTGVSFFSLAPLTKHIFFLKSPENRLLLTLWISASLPLVPQCFPPF